MWRSCEGEEDEKKSEQRLLINEIVDYVMPFIVCILPSQAYATHQIPLNL